MTGQLDAPVARLHSTVGTGKAPGRMVLEKRGIHFQN